MNYSRVNELPLIERLMTITSRAWLMATLTAVTAVTAVTSSLGAPLVPAVASQFEVSISTAQWVLTSTMIAAAATTPVLGRLATGRRRRPVIIGGLLVVLAGCLLSAVPGYLPALFAGRALQGVGLALAPVIIAVARDTWSGEERNRRMSLLSVAGVAGASIGYPLSGLAARHVGVAGTYLGGAALVLASLGLAARFLPSHAPGDAHTVDIPSVITLAGGLCAGLLAISQGVDWGWTSRPVITLALLSGALLALWLFQTLRLAASGGQPLVDLSVALHPGVAPAHAVALSLAIGTYALMTLAVLLVSTSGAHGWGLGLGATAAGLVILPYAFASVLGSRVALRVPRRVGQGFLLPIGSVLFGTAMAVLAIGHRSLAAGIAAMALGGFASGLAFSSTPALIVSHVDAAEASSALSLNQLLRNVGFAIGSAASVTLLLAFGGDGAALSSTAWTFAAASLVVGAACWPRRQPRAD